MEKNVSKLNSEGKSCPKFQSKFWVLGCHHLLDDQNQEVFILEILNKSKLINTPVDPHSSKVPKSSLLSVCA